MKIKITINKKNAMIFLAICLPIIALIAVSGTYMNPVTHVGHDLDELGPGPLDIDLIVEGDLIVDSLQMENLADINLSKNLANILCLANWSYCLDVTLVEGDHSSLECYEAGGTLDQDPEDGPDDYFCKMPGTCPSGWELYNDWTETARKFCDGSGACGPGSNDCTTGGHEWSINPGRETCGYKTWHGCCPVCESKTCRATWVYQGCK